MDWSDLHTALAVGQHKSLKQAARALGVNPTTVSRRIKALEEELGVALFVRARSRWRPTPAGRTVLARCARMAEEVRGLRHDTDVVMGQARGRVRVTAINAILMTWLVPHVERLRRAHPALQVEFFATNEVVDLTRGRADIALRHNPPEQAGLVIKRLIDISLVVAARPEVAALPRSERPALLLGFLDTESPENEAVRAVSGDVACTTTSVTALDAMVRAGLGVGLVHRPIAEREGLTIVSDATISRRLWRAVPEEIAAAPRIRAVTDWLDALFSASAA